MIALERGLSLARMSSIISAMPSGLREVQLAIGRELDSDQASALYFRLGQELLRKPSAIRSLAISFHGLYRLQGGETEEITWLESLPNLDDLRLNIWTGVPMRSAASAASLRHLSFGSYSRWPYAHASLSQPLCSSIRHLTLDLTLHSRTGLGRPLALPPLDLPHLTILALNLDHALPLTPILSSFAFSPLETLSIGLADLFHEEALDWAADELLVDLSVKAKRVCIWFTEDEIPDAPVSLHFSLPTGL